METAAIEYFIIGARPVKLLITDEADMDVLAYQWESQEFRRAPEYLHRVTLGTDDEHHVKQEEFEVQLAEARQRPYRLQSDQDSNSPEYARMARRINADYGGHAELVLDYYSQRLVYETVDDMYHALEKVSEEQRATLVGYWDRFAEPQQCGYRDIILNFTMPGGFIIERRLCLQGIEDLNPELERYRTQIQTIEAQYMHKDQPFSEDVSAQIIEMMNVTNTMYKRAFAIGQRGEER
ncbi:hypothetical protein ccbrp13_31170 [Ktedonobacteria bacterium brp13]|nr:hypothetical protein ccbrp13_31170 [Ktedonobacteria bacterium brp13]